MGKVRGKRFSSRTFPGFFGMGSLALVLVFLGGLAVPAPGFARTVFVGAGTDISNYYSSALTAIGMASTTGRIVYLGFDLDSVTSLRVVREWGTIEPSGRYSATGLVLERVLRERVSAGLGFGLTDPGLGVAFGWLPIADAYGRVSIITVSRSSVDVLVGFRTVFVQTFSEMGVGPSLAIVVNGIL